MNPIITASYIWSSNCFWYFLALHHFIFSSALFIIHSQKPWEETFGKFSFLLTLIEILYNNVILYISYKISKCNTLIPFLRSKKWLFIFLVQTQLAFIPSFMISFAVNYSTSFQFLVTCTNNFKTCSFFPQIIFIIRLKFSSYYCCLYSRSL